MRHEQRRCCQTNANQPQFFSDLNLLGCAKAAPLGKSGGAVKLEVFSAVEVAFLVEMIVDRRVGGDEFLQGSHAPKADHYPFSSSEWLM